MENRTEKYQHHRNWLDKKKQCHNPPICHVATRKRPHIFFNMLSKDASCILMLVVFQEWSL